MLLITGATGNVGGEVMRKLSAAGHESRVLVRNPRAAGLKLPHVTVMPGDYTDAASLVKALDGVQAAFFAGPIDQDYPKWFTSFLAKAKKAGVRHLVKLSLLGAAADSPSEIIRQHAETDKQLKASGIEFTILQPNSFYQNLIRQVRSIQTEGRFYIPAGEARQSLVDVRDVAAVAVKALTEPGHAGRVYALTGPQALAFDDVARQLSAAVGRPVEYVPVTLEAMRDTFLSAGAKPWTAQALVDLIQVLTGGVYSLVTPDTGQVLRREPLSFAKFARDYAGTFSAGVQVAGR